MVQYVLRMYGVLSLIFKMTKKNKKYGQSQISQILLIYHIHSYMNYSSKTLFISLGDILNGFFFILNS